MKKGFGMLTALLLGAVLIFGCARGDVKNAERIVGDSELYSSAAIEKAMDVVIRQFEREFPGCTLLEVEYDEEVSAKHSGEWAEQYDAHEAIVLLSSFRTDEKGGKGNLNPDYTYERFQWVLTRSFWGGWKIQTMGYA